MVSNKRKRLSGTKAIPKGKTSRPLGSHVVTLDSTTWNSKLSQEVVEYTSNEYHLTARVTNSSLGVRDLGLVLSVLNYQIVHRGANLNMVLALYELYRRCMGNSPSSEEINDGYIRLTVSVSEIIIANLKGKDLSLYQGEFVRLDPEIEMLLMPYLMSKRTYSSRYSHWRPEKYIIIQAVPVSALYERISATTKRYSGYTKGYGESHGNAHRFKTKPSVELDGEDVPDKVERNLILRMTDPIHQSSNSLWIKYRNLKEQD